MKKRSRAHLIARGLLALDAVSTLTRAATSPFSASADLAKGMLPGPHSKRIFKSDDPVDRFVERFGGLTDRDISEQISISFRSFWTLTFALLFWSAACIFAEQSTSHSPLLIIAVSWTFRGLVAFILAGLAAQRSLINWQFRHQRLGFAEFARGLDWLPHPSAFSK